MNARERQVVKVWAAVALMSAAAMSLYGLLTLLMLFGITIPLVLFINFMPTVFLYLTPALILYFGARRALRRWRVPRRAIALASAALVLGAGFAIPVWGNRQVERRVQAVMAGDTGSEPRIEPVETIASLVDAGLNDPQQKCWDECQRLLFSGLARNVVQGPLEALGNPGHSPVPLIRHSIVPLERGCDNRLLNATYASDAEWNGPRPPPYLWEKLDDFAERGLCFRSDATRDGRADIYLVRTYNHDPTATGRRYFNLSLVPIEPFERREVLRREGARLVPLMRRTWLRFHRLAVPLRVTPPASFATYSPGHWAYAGTDRRGEEPTYDGMMGHWLKNDVRITGLGARRAEIVVSGPRDPAEPRN